MARETIGLPGKQERKPILYFTYPDGSECPKSLVLNVTNGKVLRQLYGDNVADWEGKPIVLYHAMVDLRGEQKEAIRLRAPKAPPQSAAPERPAADMDDEIPF